MTYVYVIRILILKYLPKLPLRSILVLYSDQPLNLPSDCLFHLLRPCLISPSVCAACPTHLALIDLITLTVLVKRTMCEAFQYVIISDSS